ncbi:hypothetical protein C5B85_03775 [Pseudoclavibacter sp. AY1F1]|uniref:hypothetical protein n=1 Tax=Pseudoclavibacter sp. AY1F1 TaxID=2080583 RepID=UPI000CE7EBD6|nr:hypothetical protein [Pseudoclavibacter sp. AY1F1]PPF47381.1 hypothetical protein C5B85_03775 [Pseudoclavibacter sp. AY1F1]
MSAQGAGTLDRLLASPHTMLRKVALTPEALAYGLVGFGTATATTRNAVCTMHQIGSYDLPTACGSALVPPSAWITLRVRPTLLGAAVIAHDEGVPGALPTLYVYSSSGHLVHRVLVHSEADAQLLSELGRSRGLTEAQLARAQLSRAEETGWRDGDQLAQLDAVFEDGGADRHAALVRGGSGEARGVWGVGGVGSSRGVDCSVVSALFEHLSSVGLPVCVGVPSSAVLQLSAGRVHLVERVGSLLVVSLGEGIVELDLSALRSCLLVTSWGPQGPTTALELYDEHSRCVAVLTQLGLVGQDVLRSWEHMLESLPAA